MSERIVLVAHGTRSLAGQRTMVEVAARVQQQLPGRGVQLGWIELVEPAFTDVLAAGQSAIVVPLLLGSGYHVRVDLAQAVAGHPGSLLAEPLSVGLRGTGSGIIDALTDRLAETSSGRDAVVLAAAGSSDERSRAQAAAVAAELAAHRGAAVHPAFLTGPGPSVDETIVRLRATVSPTVTAAAYLLAEGFFYGKLIRGVADRVTRPLGAHPGVIRQIVDRVNDLAPTAA